MDMQISVHSRPYLGRIDADRNEQLLALRDLQETIAHFHSAPKDKHFDTFSRRVRSRREVPARFRGAKWALRLFASPWTAPPYMKHGAAHIGWQNSGKMLLVFGCIGTDLCKLIRVCQHFLRSTRLSS